MIHGTADTIVPYTYSLHYQRIYFLGQLKLIPEENHGFIHNLKGAAQAVTGFFIQQLMN